MPCKLIDTIAFKMMVAAKRCNSSEVVYMSDDEKGPMFNCKFAKTTLPPAVTPVKMTVYRKDGVMVVTDDSLKSKTHCMLAPFREVLPHIVDDLAFLKKVKLVNDEGVAIDESCCRELDFDETSPTLPEVSPSVFSAPLVCVNDELWAIASVKKTKAIIKLPPIFVEDFDLSE